MALRAQALTVRRVLGFALCFTLLQLTWQAASDGAAGDVVTYHASAVPAAAAINLITPGIGAYAFYDRVWAPGGGIRILNGCEGVEILFLLVAALAVTPVSARRRLVGLLIGIAFVFVLNQVRLVTLFYAFRESPGLFNTLHSLVMPILMVIGVLCYFQLWFAWRPGNAASLR